LTRSQSAVIRQPQFKARPAEPGPEADTAHIKNFGEGLKGVDFGRKYDFKVSDTPGPTKYNPDNTLMKNRSQAALIRQKTSNYQKPME
jgi:hypothetical protein